MNYPWLFTMAWRDSRRNRSRLLFMSSVVLGIAALVAINSFGGPPIPHHEQLVK
jgi:putative ABC transport system permease protein